MDALRVRAGRSFFISQEVSEGKHLMRFYLHHRLRIDAVFKGALHVADPAQWRFQGGQVGAGFCLEGRIQPGKKLQMPH